MRSSTLESLLAGRYDVPPAGGHRRLLDAQPARQRLARGAEPRADLLPPHDDAARRGVPDGLQDGRRRREGNVAPGPSAWTFWNCGVLGGFRRESTVPMCPNPRRAALRLHVDVPELLGRQESRQHQSPEPRCLFGAGTGPRGSRTRCRRSRSIYRYPTTGGAGVTLASGGQFSGHADFFNAWRQSDLQALVDGCLNALRHCQRGS